MDRESAFSLIELVVALTFITLGIVGVFSVFFVNSVASQSTGQRDEMRVALENVSELVRFADFKTLYATYHGTNVEVPELEDPGGGPAKVTITCYVDETTLPAEFGPVLDLDGKGGLATTDCSATYKLLPVELSVTYVDRGFVETRQVHLLIGEKG